MNTKAEEVNNNDTERIQEGEQRKTRKNNEDKEDKENKYKTTTRDNK